MIIYLPGNSPLNKDELEMFSNKFSENEEKHYAHEYEHWNDESKSFVLSNEIERIKEVIKNEEFEDYGIVSKSIGTWAAVNLLKELANKKPKFVVLMGVPSELSGDNFDTYKNNLKESGAKVFAINNEKDPFVDHDTVKSLLEGIDHEIITVSDNDTHRYQNVDEVWELIKKLT